MNPLLILALGAGGLLVLARRHNEALVNRPPPPGSTHHHYAQLEKELQSGDPDLVAQFYVLIQRESRPEVFREAAKKFEQANKPAVAKQLRTHATALEEIYKDPARSIFLRALRSQISPTDQHTLNRLIQIGLKKGYHSALEIIAHKYSPKRK